ncbi:APC family permease [Streptomyces sp. KE1]|uniref:APC family permease n=1 Tax=Streptomyces sp. KE1 TaxID=1638939 RepID=UPI00063ECD49|nr:APC family permease [Streptomyces sp. KE1]KLJ04600.1 amino acid transporter [Streptomyces sp. KE1]
MTDTRHASPPRLSTAGAAALYIGALLGPSLLLLPGLAAREAGPASVLVWLGLLFLSGLIALVFTRLGTRAGSATGVAGYTAAGLGPRAGQAAAWCFLAGVVTGAPVVCLIGGAYVAELLGAGGRTAYVAALCLLGLVLAVRLGGLRTGSGLQLVLVAVLVTLVVVAVAGAAPEARAAHWTPFAPDGWAGVARAASPLMLAFVGWEAVAPLTARLRDPRRQLPRVVGTAFAVTALLYLGLAVATVAVLGPRAGGPVPLAGLLRVAIGGYGPLLAAVAAVALTLAATHAYLTGATAMAAALAGVAARRGTAGIVAAVAATSTLLLGAAGAGLVTTTQLVAVPTALFLLVYLGCMAAAVRLLAGPVRLAAGVACAVVGLLLAGSGWAALVAVAVALVAGARGRPAPSARVRSRAPERRHNPEAGRSEPVDSGPASDVCGQSVTGP